MSAPKHTQGPWIARPDPNSILPDSLVTDNWCIGVEGSIDKVAVCSARDARLIAAAPDLLEALQDVVPELEYMAGGMTHSLWKTKKAKECLERVRDAIAKATGEGA